MKQDEKVFIDLFNRSFEIIHLARIEQLKKSSGIMVVRGRTLPELTSSTHRTGHTGNRSELSKNSQRRKTKKKFCIGFV